MNDILPGVKRWIPLLAAAVCLTPAALIIRIPVEAIGPNHPDCPGGVVDLDPGAATPIGGVVWMKAGDDHVSIGFQPAGFVIPTTFDGKETSHADVCPETPPPPPPPPPSSSTTTTSTSTTTTQPDTSTSSSSTPSAPPPPPAPTPRQQLPATL